MRAFFASTRWNRFLTPKGRSRTDPDAWNAWDQELVRFIFVNQDTFHPGIRKLTKDVHVGKDARYWLDVLGDPADRDLFPEGRKFAPEHEVGEVDLVQAIKAISCHLNFFSDAPEPRIEVESITFTGETGRREGQVRNQHGGLHGHHLEFYLSQRW